MPQPLERSCEYDVTTTFGCQDTPIRLHSQLVHMQVHYGKYTIPVLLIGAFLLWTHDRSPRAVCTVQL